MIILEPNTDVQLSLESQLERLALEANAIANLINTFKNILPALTAKISSALNITDDKHNSDLIKDTLSLYKELHPKLEYVNYVDYAQTLVSVPESFKGDLLAYIKLINKITPGIYFQVQVMLNEYKTLLSTFITNKDAKILLKDDTGFFKKLEVNRLSLTKEMDVFYPKHTNKTKAYLGDTIARFGDLDELIKEISALDKKHIAQNINQVNELVKECVDLLNIVIANIENGSIGNVSGASSMNLSVGAYEVAKYIEFLSAFRFKTMQAIASAAKLVEQLNTIIK